MDQQLEDQMRRDRAALEAEKKAFPDTPVKKQE